MSVCDTDGVGPPTASEEQLLLSLVSFGLTQRGGRQNLSERDASRLIKATHQCRLRLQRSHDEPLSEDALLTSATEPACRLVKLHRRTAEKLLHLEEQPDAERLIPTSET